MHPTVPLARPVSVPSGMALHEGYEDNSEEDLFMSREELLHNLVSDVHTQQSRAIRAMATQASKTVPANDDGVEILQDWDGDSKPRSLVETIVPSLRDEMIYDCIGTTFTICKLCLERPKQIRANPCGHMLCTECKIEWESKLNYHGDKFGFSNLNRKCPFCKTDISSFQLVDVKSRLQPEAISECDDKHSAVLPTKDSCGQLLETPAQADEVLFPLPSYWDVRSNSVATCLDTCNLVNINLDGDEAQSLSVAFRSTFGNRCLTITEIKRVENVTLWQSYCMARRLMMTQCQQQVALRSQATWEVLADHGWCEYETDTATILEAAFRQGQPNSTIIVNNRSYNVTYDRTRGNHVQESKTYGTTREVRRWAPYSAEMERRDAASLAAKYERVHLYHGTDRKSVHSIIQHGLNRSYGGKNGVAYGRGVYFSRTSEYASHERYATPDEFGLRRVILCRVLVGESCQGSPGQIVPGIADHKTNRLYDTTVDNRDKPNIFVTYKDHQAYPEYVMEFRMR